MKIGYFEFRYLLMEDELYWINKRVENIEEAAVESIRVVQNCLTAYKEYFKTYGIEKRADKILFFKYLKPKVIARLIYHTEVFNWWTNRPKYDAGIELQVYWERKVDMLVSYVQEHSFLSRYMIRDSTWLDAQLFLPENRNKFYHWGIPNELDSVTLYDDPDYSASHDHIVARILAYSKLYQFCNDQLRTRAEVADFRGGAETTFDVVPLLQRYNDLATATKTNSPATTPTTNALPRHIPRHEHYRLLDRFMNHNLTSSSRRRRRRNARMSRRMRRKIRRFLHIWAAENRDVEYEKPAETGPDMPEE